MIATFPPGSTGVVRSVNLGAAVPTEHSTMGVTGIDKRPADGPVLIVPVGPKGSAGSGLAGDEVCDLRHHGGDDQAVYAYAREDLDDWQDELGKPLRDGMFGENLTIAGLDLRQAIVGEIWSIGADLRLQITVPRIPCRTFAGFLAEPGWIKRFTAKGATGTYLRVLTPGAVAAGDPITVVDRPDHGVTVLTAFRAFTTESELLPLLTDVPSLGAEARATVERRLGITSTPSPS